MRLHMLIHVYWHGQTCLCTSAEWLRSCVKHVTTHVYTLNIHKNTCWNAYKHVYTCQCTQYAFELGVCTLYTDASAHVHTGFCTCAHMLLPMCTHASTHVNTCFCTCALMLPHMCTHGKAHVHTCQSTCAHITKHMCIHTKTHVNNVSAHDILLLDAS
jgi:hypothetical protein